MSQNPEVAQAIEDFAFRLRRARRDAGERSLRDLAQRMSFRGSASTLQRAFAGDTLPTWPVVEALLSKGFNVPAEIVNDEWLPLWVAVKDVESPLLPPAHRADRHAGAHPDDQGDRPLAVITSLLTRVKRGA
jgi:hypothetical protein